MNSDPEAISEETIECKVTSELHSELPDPKDKNEADAEDSGCSALVSSDKKYADVEKNKSDSSCCAITRQQFDCKNGANKQESSSNSADLNDDLGVAMQKLESMRLNDKSKRKLSNVGKRQNHLSKDSNLISNNDSNSVTQRPKSSPSGLSQLASPPSKARKRKPKKRSKANQNGNNSDDSGTCKMQNDEVTPETTSRNTCDSITNFDSCVNRTNSKDGKCTTRNWASDNENLYLSSHGSDSLR